MTMRILLVLAAIVGFSGYVSAQTAAPNSGKPLKRVTPRQHFGVPPLPGRAQRASVSSGSEFRCKTISDRLVEIGLKAKGK